MLYFPLSLSLPVHVAAVFFVTVLMFGLNIWAAAVLMMVVCMIILHMFGCMHLLGINANAVSLVNLVMVSRVTQTSHTIIRSLKFNNTLDKSYSK